MSEKPDLGVAAARPAWICVSAQSYGLKVLDGTAGIQKGVELFINPFAPNYAVTPDGQHFVVVEVEPGQATITVVENWIEQFNGQ